MHDVRVDLQKNRLYIVLIGYLGIEELEDLEKDVKKEISKLKPNFDLINDISEFNPIDEEGIEKTKDIQRLIMSNSVRYVVRVTSSDEIHKQLESTKLAANVSYNVELANSITEAEEILNEK